MKTALQKIELIEKYLEGQLKGQQLMEFEVKLTNDAAFRQEVVIQNELYQSIKREGRRGLIAELNQIHKGIYGGTVSFFSRYKLLFISTVTGIIIISISFLFYKYSWNKNPQSTSDHIPPAILAEMNKTDQSMVDPTSDTMKNIPVLTKNFTIENKIIEKANEPATLQNKTNKTVKITHKTDDYDKVSIEVNLSFDISEMKLTLKEIFVNHPQYGFHYQIKDSNLYLYSDLLFEDIKVYYYQNDDKYHLIYNDEDFPLEETGKILPLIAKKSTRRSSKTSTGEEFKDHQVLRSHKLPRTEGEVSREVIKQPVKSLDNDSYMNNRKTKKNKTGRTILQITDIDSLPNALPDVHQSQDLYYWEIIDNDAEYTNHYLIKDNRLYLYGDFLEKIGRASCRERV